MEQTNQICETCINFIDNSKDKEKSYCELWDIEVSQNSSCSEHTFKLVFDELPNE